MKKENQSRGFTLIELLIVLLLVGLALGVMGQIFLSQADAYKSQVRVVQRHQGLRAALEIIARDFRGAGYPVLDPSFLASLSSWIPQAFIPKAPQTVIPDGVYTGTPGGNNPDSLSMLVVLSGETNPSGLSQAAQAGDTAIVLSLNSSETNDQFNLNDLLYLGKPPELAQIKGISGNVLTIDTDPFLAGNQGLNRSHPAGTEVGEISYVSYAVFNDNNDPTMKYHEPGIPVLKRKINAGGFEPLAEGITDLKISREKPELLRLQLSADSGLYHNRLHAPKEPIVTMNTQIMKRN